MTMFSEVALINRYATSSTMRKVKEATHHQVICLYIKERHCCIASHAILRLLPLQQLQSAIHSGKQGIIWDGLCRWQ